MITHRFGATHFHLLEKGERLAEKDLGYHTTNFYIIWPVGDEWDARYKFYKGWEKVSDKMFNTQNEAFLCCHADYLKREEETERRWRRD